MGQSRKGGIINKKSTFFWEVEIRIGHSKTEKAVLKQEYVQI